MLLIMNKLSVNTPKHPASLSKTPKITPKLKRYCKEYVIDHNQTQAAIRAGYSPKSAQQVASKNMSKDVVSSLIAELEKKAADDLGITHRYVLGGVKGSAEDNKSKNPSVSLKAFELMGDHIGTFKDELHSEDRPMFVGISINVGGQPIDLQPHPGEADVIEVEPKKEPRAQPQEEE